MDSRQPTDEADQFHFAPGKNCWRVARADKLALIVDGAAYFRHLRQVLTAARREILFVGWDFDFEIDMLPGESDAEGLAPDGLPNALGPFLEAIVSRAPDLQVYLLKWNGAMLVAPGRMLPAMGMAVFGSDRVHFALDGHHPFGACHHQKIVTVDDQFAFCGGIDATENRWDTPEHLSDEPRRTDKDGTQLPPWHDVTSATCGPVARALAELSRNRWSRATGEDLAPLPADKEHGEAIWPEDLCVETRDVDVAIARTMPPFDGALLINEVEDLYLDSIRSARHAIYIETQYFAAELLCAALEARLRETGGPEIVVVNPLEALSQFEDDAMHALRDRLIAELREADHEDRFRTYYPVSAASEPIYVHAKVMIVDDTILHLGSANINDRSMGFDTECDIAITGPAEVIAGFRQRLLAEHLGVDEDVFEQTHRRCDSLIDTVETLNPREGRRLRPLTNRPDTLTSRFLATTRLMDPRYQPGRPASAGQGIRPRHLVAAAGVAVLGYLAWRALRK
jgi:phosphatidylserine/phosphatidylglycerophosphate/cardiolipin synthase-like enzyme